MFGYWILDTKWNEHVNHSSVASALTSQHNYCAYSLAGGGFGFSLFITCAVDNVSNFGSGNKLNKMDSSHLCFTFWKPQWLEYDFLEIIYHSSKKFS